MPGRLSRSGWSVLTPDILLAGVAIGLIVISALVRPGGLPFIPICQFKHWTGLSCPGCGITRAFCAISHGDLASAWAFNPFSFVFYLAVLCVIAWPIVRRLWPGIGEKIGLSGKFVILPVLLVLLMWVYGLCRIAAEIQARWG